MDIPFLIQGLAIGFSIAAPVGPIGVLCIRRTLTDGRASSLVSGLGAATADAIYGGIAGFGLAFVSNFLVSQQVRLRLVGGALTDPVDTAVLLFRADSVVTVHDFAENDPYVKNGLVASWRVRQWATVVGDDASSPIRVR